MLQGKPGRLIVERLQEGEDLLGRLNQLVVDCKVQAGSLTAIGSLSKAELGFYEGNGRYATTTHKGPFEVLSCVGSVSLKQDARVVHVHIALADKKGRAYGGHVMPGCIVDSTFEVFIQEIEGITLQRKLDGEKNLYLLDA